ncbi:DNA adenine methylase [Clostridium estertheticum]|uniref:DNA adenine methylase n=1 Tax=Clostridium estertheticum TaxID=238834 RepID=UPI00124C5D59|nr:DNA adenine methylase [Clostridium estertheticum]MBZ9615275.1 DNA adenine methylase [Clostridium estertheticum subsp. laramiense]WAG75164.1 DNA adenine methylase [Clostridium estertheticum]
MNSFISWIGGKKLLRKEIMNRFPESFNRYIEVFGGAGWVLFGKDKHADIEIYNDANGDLVNLFKCVKYHCGELQRELSFMLNSRELFLEFRDQYSLNGSTDIQRAARFFMVIKTSYGSDCKSYGCVKRNISVMVDYLTDIQKRLQNVVIEHKDFQNLIKVYDRIDALIYLDPPYYGTEKYYQAQFNKDDHVRLNETLKNIKGKFLLSYNDCEFIRELYKDFNIEEIQRNHNLKNKDGKSNMYNELIIKNY